MQSSDENIVHDMTVSGYSFDGGVNIISFTDETIIEEDIVLTSGIDERDIRVYLKWIDGDNETMDNEDDTLTTVGSNNLALIDVIVEFTQITE